MWDISLRKTHSDHGLLKRHFEQREFFHFELKFCYSIVETTKHTLSIHVRFGLIEQMLAKNKALREKQLRTNNKVTSLNLLIRKWPVTSIVLSNTRKRKRCEDKSGRVAASPPA